MASNFGVYNTDNVPESNFDIGPLTDALLGDSVNDSLWFDRDFKFDSVSPFVDDTTTISNGGGNLHYAELRNLRQNPVQHSISGHEPQRDDDGYGSQIFVSGAMEPTTEFDDFDPISRERCHTWPSVQREVDEDRDAMMGQRPVGPYRRQRQQHGQFSPSTPFHGSSGLSQISESRESLLSTGPATFMQVKSDGDDTKIGQWLVTPANMDDHKNGVGNALIVGTNSRHSSGSDVVEPVVKPVTMTNYKAGHPSYVELITTAILSSGEKRMTLSEIYDWMVANVPAFKDQRYLHSSSGWKNSVRHNLSLHSRFKRVKRNGMDKPSWWTVDLTEESKRERNNKRQSKQSRPRANTTTAAMTQKMSSGYYRQVKTARIDSPMDSNPMMARHQSFSGSQANSADIRRGSLPANIITSAQLSKSTSGRSTSILQDGADQMEWTTYQSVNVEKQVYVPTNVDCLSHAITVTLCDSPADGSAAAGDSKPDIALTLTVNPDPESPFPTVVDQAGNPMTNLVNEFRQNTLSEATGRQLLRVQTSSGNVHQVSVPVPMPVRVVMRAHKDCQTDQATSTTPDILNSFWNDTPLKHDQIPTLDECLMALTGDLNTVPNQFSQAISTPSTLSPNQQLVSPVGMQPDSTTMVLASGYQPAGGHCIQNARHQSTNSSIMTSSPGVALLPDDLAAVDVRDSFDCNIMDILSYEMNCGAVSNSTEF